MADAKTTIQDVPATIRHLRPRGRDVIHVTVGGELADGSTWIPSQDEMVAIVDDWRVKLPGYKIVVTPIHHVSQVDPDPDPDTSSTP